VGLHDGVRYKGRRHLISAKPAAVQALDGFLGGFDRVKLDIDFALRRYVNGVKGPVRKIYLSFFLDLDGFNFAVFVLTFAFHIISEVPVPVSFGFSAEMVSSVQDANVKGTDSSGLNMFFKRTERDCID
jgi:hypothetical protein